MTLASVFAQSDEVQPGRSIVGVIADSRVTLGNDRYLDSFVKTRTLDERTLVVGAGHSIPMSVAIELARTELSIRAEKRAARGEPPASLWHQAGVFVNNFIFLCRDRYEQFFDNDKVEAFVAGFWSDNSPGVVHVSFSENETYVGLHRPNPGQRCFLTTGTREWQSPLLAAMLDCDPLTLRIWPAVSVMWDICKHEGAKSVGGGVALGICRSDSKRCRWPYLRLGQDIFWRGIRVDPSAFEASDRQLPNNQYNPSAFAKYEQADEPYWNTDDCTVAEYEISHEDGGADGTPGLLDGEEPSYVTSTAETPPKELRLPLGDDEVAIIPYNDLQDLMSQGEPFDP